MIQKIGQFSSFAAFAVLAAYLPTLILGLLSLKSPLDPIGDPYFSILELLIVIVAPLMVISMIAIYNYASQTAKGYGIAALIFMTIMAGITSSVHFVILTVSQQIEAAGVLGTSFLFSFKWPSVAYTMDILAWDLFFALSMIFAAFIFNSGQLEKAVRSLMIASGVLSFVGIFGIPFLNETPIIRNIGIIGYAVVSLGVFFLLGVALGKPRSKQPK
jgi:hypothetical protein